MAEIKLLKRIEKLEKIITASTITLRNPDNEDEVFVFRFDTTGLVLEHKLTTKTITTRNLETYTI